MGTAEVSETILLSYVFYLFFSFHFLLYIYSQLFAKKSGNTKY
jgi:hypothetical protein